MRSEAIGLIAIGALGLMSYKPFYDPDAQTRGWDWLPYVVLAVFAGSIAVGVYRLVKSFRRLPPR